MNYLFVELPADVPTPEEVEAVRERSLRKVMEQGDREESVTDAVLADAIDDAIDTIMEIKRLARSGSLQNILDHFEELRLIARVSTPLAEINVLRQGFILLMTAFDAAVFDLVRIALRDRFFSLIGLFGRQEKVSLERLGSFANFEAFRDQIIEEQLKTRYLKDLLFLLNGLGVPCVDETAGDRFADLVELVLRRNVHVHNRGFVINASWNGTRRDSRSSIYSAFRWATSQPLTSYRDRAIRLCRNSATRIAAWSECK